MLDVCLDNFASEEQLAAFNDDGYLIVENALPPDLVARLNVVIDRIDAEEREQQGLGPHQMMTKFGTILADVLFLELLDYPTTFPLVCDILGWNIQHYISHLIMYPPAPPGAERVRKGAGWHQDGGQPIPDMERPHPRLSLKVAFWFSDVSDPDKGALRIIPGSHKLDELPARSDPDGDPDGAMHVLVQPGTAVLFDRRMWHSRGWNYSDETRKVLFLGYSYRWLRGLDYNLMPPELLRTCDPIRRQLLGDGVDIKGWWQPTEGDVPLKQWLRKHRGDEYVA
ncbi:phytanoyl-CoA dioxygenase [Candidatus Poribacteria bacterium]|jgi:ectoine hydroxylase|nr:phytanoyl-CoA dioxygenase [Candidatus Poribacteria bacterium]MBT5533296.1 phytanoyl-CoA dioxygenase [Candidatus Poribacteria bacterium]MBT5713969.1 phytanoyl-CoA dioxygenase [Candidatus Poribacteria bacterium]MBT7808448.1 phytanoyl-CoA dioxygenase [Candidatus Poribacteria bacterium]